MFHLSVIIPAYMSRAEHLEMVLRCRQSVAQTIDPARSEILIQDDASPAYDGSKLLGRGCQRNPDNLGFPGNCNAAAYRARGEVLLFLNQDCWAIHQGWDESLCDFFEFHCFGVVAHGVFPRAWSGLMSSHGDNTVVQDDYADVSFVIGNV